MDLDLQNIKQSAEQELKTAKSPKDLEVVKIKYLGRQEGLLTQILRNLKNLSEKDKKEIGPMANEIKNWLIFSIDGASKKIGDRKLGAPHFFDPTIPGEKQYLGHLHPHTQIAGKVAEIFLSMGFNVVDGDEAINDYYNFESLNIPADHPARDMWDTFYLSDEKGKKFLDKEGKAWLLRTHTSSMQVKTMEQQKPPIKTCVIGKCFRHEATDASHGYILYQIEGFMVDENISIANLIFILKEFLNKLFNQQVNIRLRSSYFPFTEPSYEVDFSCLNCGGRGPVSPYPPAGGEGGCPVCKNSGWVELLGCGMIHPKVLEYAGYPKGKYTGFAFGFGFDRLVMLKHKIEDIRHFHSQDLRFIRQF